MFQGRRAVSLQRRNDEILTKILLTTTTTWVILFSGGKQPMIVYSRGSKNLAGATSLKNRMPATVGAFSPDKDIAHWLERTASQAVGSGFESRYPSQT